MYIASNVRHLGMDRANAKKVSFDSSVQRMAMMVTLVGVLNVIRKVFNLTSCPVCLEINLLTCVIP
jgi:hypothetical protein